MNAYDDCVAVDDDRAADGNVWHASELRDAHAASEAFGKIDRVDYLFGYRLFITHTMLKFVVA